MRRHLDEDVKDEVMEGVLPEKTAGALSFPMFRNWWDKLKQVPGALKKFRLEKVPGMGVGAGAYRVRYDGKEIGYLGFPLEELERFSIPFEKFVQPAQEAADDVTWKAITQRYSSVEDGWLEDTQNKRNEARRAFMYDPDIQTEAQLQGMTVEELWTVMGQDWMEEYWRSRTASSKQSSCPNCKSSNQEEAKEAEFENKIA